MTRYRVYKIFTGHDSNSCLFEDGKVKKYFLSERFTRKKHDECEKILYKLKKDLNIRSFDDKKDLLRDYMSHHINHAALAFYNSGFDESIVVVIDACGREFPLKNGKCVHETESVYYCEYPSTFKLLYKHVTYVDGVVDDGIRNPNSRPWPESYCFDFDYDYDLDYEFCGTCFSIGVLFEHACLMIGVTPEDSGKVMGLSSYGKEHENFPKLFEKNLFRKEFVEESKSYDFHGMKLYDFLNSNTKITKENYIPYADYAYQLQKQSQEAASTLIEKGLNETETNNVCISGGYGMDIVSNHYYLKKFPNVNFYFEPISGDAGQSIGYAMLHYRIVTKDATIYPLQHTFFHGFEYDVSSYKGIATSIKDVANLLIQDKSIAVYTGLAEAGQRALGNRSILFNALNPDAKDLVNKIKKREWYRPFACMVLEEDANIYFDMDNVKSSPFMTICFPVRPEYVKIIPGVTHIDNTCRIQTVSNTGGYLYELLQEFKKLSGHGILLNTSFNLAGEPLVETPKDAFNTLNNSCLDYLWFEETQQLFRNTP
jgi:carbamoyltransferase